MFGIASSVVAGGADPIGGGAANAEALDRVKAAEAKYTAMGETAEKLESTLKEFKGTGGSMGEAPGHFQSQGRARGEFDLVWRHRRIASQRGSVAQRRRRIEQQGVAHLVEVSALENAENKV